MPKKSQINEYSDMSACVIPEMAILQNLGAFFMWQKDEEKFWAKYVYKVATFGRQKSMSCGLW